MRKGKGAKRICESESESWGKVKPTMMTEPTNIRYQTRSSFRLNLEFSFSSWLRYEYRK